MVESSTVIAVLSGVVTIESIYIAGSLFAFVLLIYHCWYKKKSDSQLITVDTEKKKTF